MVFVVDDHQDTREVITFFLKHHGYIAVAFEDGVKALQAIQAIVPHCIILDYNMPEMDGLEVLAAIRKDSRFDHVRVIMYTAGDAELRQRCLAAGADAFVQKASLDWVRLKELIENLCVVPSKAPSTPTTKPLNRNRDAG